MKYLPCCLAIVFGCIAVGVGLFITKNPNCLWGLWLVVWLANETYPSNN